MTKHLEKLWTDDGGAIIAAEYLFVATILVIGIIVGLASVRDGVNTELAELANAYLALSQGYTVSGQSGCCSATDGSEANDGAFDGKGFGPTRVPDPLCTAPAIPSAIDVVPCN